MGIAATVENAPAKINLALHVIRRRGDGYHDLDSLVVFAAIGDKLELLDERGAPELLIDGPFATALTSSVKPETNLVLRAAGAVAERAGIPTTGRLRLTKNLPIAAGLGGGSADAAAALRLLGQRHGLNLTAIASLARPLGADVPMCLRSVPLRATGDGDGLTEIAIPSLPIVLAYPATPVSTPAVFGRLSTPDNPPLPPLPKSFQSAADVVDWLAETRNDLEPAARLEAPIIDQALADLANASGALMARMSGSGSTCFAILATRAAADMAAVELQRAHPDWWVRATITGAAS